MTDVVVVDAWEKVRDALRADLGERTFELWFARSRIVALQRGVLTVGVPNLFIRDWVDDRYGRRLAELATEALGAEVQVAVKVDPDLFREMRARTERIEESVETEGAEGEGKVLSTFVATPRNELALRSIRHAAEGRTPRFNPLLVYGPEGTGKTHLAWGAAAAFPSGTRVYRLTGEDFARRFAWHLKTRRLEHLRERILGAELVIVDDVDALAGKPATQHELTSVMQLAVARGAQILCFARRHPADVRNMDPGLRSMLLSGMTAGIDPPDDEEKIRILERIFATARRRIPRAVIELVVKKLGGSVKRLDREIRKIYAFAGLTGEPVTAEWLEQHAQELGGPADPAARRFETIIKAVCEHFDADRADVLSKRKTKSMAAPRGMVVWLLREQAGLTFKEIGRLLGDRSHTSVFLIHQKFAGTVAGDAVLQALAREIGRRLVAGDPAA
jgi:chromosomal replication initiator protein